jgi:threonine/homoserine/homoserine lactone efflux protein
MAGIAVLAGLVNMIELLCTAGFPALYTQILTMQQLPTWEYYGYLGLYNLAYILDDSVMVTIGVVTLSRKKLQERAGRWLKLTGGAVMLSLGLVLILKPEWLAL